MQWGLEGGLAVGSALPWAALGRAGTASLLYLAGCQQEPAQWPRGAVLLGAWRCWPGTWEPPALLRPSVSVLNLLLPPNHMESFNHCFSVI